MKKTFAVLAFITSAAVCVQAGQFSALTVTFTATATVNNPKITKAGNVTTYSAPSTVKLTNKTLLALLAAAEHAESNYSKTTFPSGAQIVFMCNNNDFSQSYFIVTDGKGKELVDVSDLLTAKIGNEVVVSGKRNTHTGLLTNFLYQGAVDISYDDTGAGGSTYFDLAGIDQQNISDTVKGYNYSETQTHTVNPVLGAGEINGNAAVFSGSFSVGGTTVFPL
jgi:hypothetical protein